VLTHLEEWFGNQVRSWQLLRVYRISKALPCQKPPALSPVAKPPRISGNLFVCGDSYDTASINGAMLSGERAAAAVLKYLNR
jgi:predicted NAD/FAD-dependent oxidoreductase